jgi:hypothetical protein
MYVCMYVCMYVYITVIVTAVHRVIDDCAQIVKRNTIVNSKHITDWSHMFIQLLLNFLLPVLLLLLLLLLLLFIFLKKLIHAQSVV